MGDNFYTAFIPPEMLERGFWLYVWIIRLRGDRTVHYVGRTGDSSSGHAQSPFGRISGHLGSNKHSNALRQNLKTHGIDFDQCISLEVVAHGPLYEEANNIDEHKLPRDKTHALERDLCNAMKDAKYEVLNEVSCKMPTNWDEWCPVRDAFARRFGLLAPLSQ
jgi:hypothetical protein